MGTCGACQREMLNADGCTDHRLCFVMIGELDPVSLGEETRHEDGSLPTDEGGRCHDCGAKPGELHHPGCDWEECPNCEGQLLSCACDFLGHAIGDEETPRFDNYGRELKHGGKNSA